MEWNSFLNFLLYFEGIFTQLQNFTNIILSLQPFQVLKTVHVKNFSFLYDLPIHFVKSLISSPSNTKILMPLKSLNHLLPLLCPSRFQKPFYQFIFSKVQVNHFPAIMLANWVNLIFNERLPLVWYSTRWYSFMQLQQCSKVLQSIENTSNILHYIRMLCGLNKSNITSLTSTFILSLTSHFCR